MNTSPLVRVSSMTDLQRLHERAPARAKEVLAHLVNLGLQKQEEGRHGDPRAEAFSSKGSRAYMDRQAQMGYPAATPLTRGARAGGCFDRSTLLYGCVDFLDICAMAGWHFPSVVVDVGSVLEVDFDALSNFKTLLDGFSFLEYSSPKIVAAPSASPVAGVTTIALNTLAGLCGGLSIRWSAPYQLTQPAVVTISTLNIQSAFIAASLRDRGSIQVELPPGTNGGWIHLPGAYRATTAMMFGAFQLITIPAAAGTLTITNCPANTLWEARMLGAFNSWTQSFVELTLDIAKQAA